MIQAATELQNNERAQKLRWIRTGLLELAEALQDSRHSRERRRHSMLSQIYSILVDEKHLESIVRFSDEQQCGWDGNPICALDTLILVDDWFERVKNKKLDQPTT